VVVVVVVVVAYTEDQLTAAIRSKLAPLVVGGFGHSQYSSVPETDAFSRTYPPEQSP
jgi:NADH:ubiquinone oxidoreductase subunit H